MAKFAFIFALTSFPAFAVKSAPSPIQVLKTFVGEMNKKEYRKAYRLFSAPLRGKVTYGDFHDGATHVRNVRLLSARLVSITLSVARARVIMEDLEKDPDETSWRKHRYSGKLAFLREKGGWHFIQVMVDESRLSTRNMRTRGGKLHGVNRK